MPKSEADAFWHFLLLDREYKSEESKGRYYIECNETASWPPLFFLFEGKKDGLAVNETVAYWLELKTEDYILDVSKMQDRSLCQIAFEVNKDDFWVFGTALYEGYYVVHEPNFPQIRFAVTTASSKIDIMEGITTQILTYPFASVHFAGHVAAVAAVGVATW